MLKRPNHAKRSMAPQFLANNPPYTLIKAAACLTLLAFATACQNDVKPLILTPSAQWTQHAKWVPAHASLTLYMPDLKDVARYTKGAPSIKSFIDAQCTTFEKHTPFALCKPNTLKGILPSNGALWFTHDAQHAISIHAPDPKRVLAQIERQQAGNAWTVTQNTDNIWQIAKKGETTPILFVLIGQQTMLLVPNAKNTLWQRSKPSDTFAWVKSLATQKHKAWVDYPRHRELVDKLTPKSAAKARGRLFGTVRVNDWLLQLAANTERAQALKAQMIDQMDTTGFDMVFDEKTKQLTTRVLSKEILSQPTTARTLKDADGDLPKLGHLLPTGTLGVVRLSADPKALEQYIMGLLPNDSRVALANYEKRLKDEFAIDLRAQVFDNVRGHAVAAVYGINPKAWENVPHPTVLLQRLLTLEATREAIFIPLHDAQKFRDMLDAITQLSKGQLKRQRVEHGIHYAWMDTSRELHWAMVVYDHAAIILDSPAAFSRANKQAKQAQALAATWQPRHLPELLQGTDRAGFYIDMTLLQTLIPKAYQVPLQPFFNAISSTTIVSKPKDRGAETTIYVQLK